MTTERVVVVGAGIAGLVSALMLAQRGLQVTVVDAATEPGGKIRRLMVDGAPIDSGPTVFTMKWIFEGILEAVGTRLDREITTHPLPVLARHFWDNGDHLDLFADPAASFDAVARFAGLAEAERFRAFCAQAREVSCAWPATSACEACRCSRAWAR